MGRRGTAVAKEAAAIVLADDNYATIVAAIEEGRTIYANLRKTILYLVSGNLGEVLTILLAMLAGLPLPFQAIQILWINLVTDALPAIGLAMEPAEPGVMDRPPRARGESFLPRWIMPLIAVPSLLLAASSLLAFTIMLGRDPYDLATAQTTAFVTLILGHLAIGWSQRATLTSSLSLSFWSNPILLLSIVLGIGSLLPLLYTEIGRVVLPYRPNRCRELGTGPDPGARAAARVRTGQTHPPPTYPFGSPATREDGGSLTAALARRGSRARAVRASAPNTSLAAVTLTGRGVPLISGQITLPPLPGLSDAGGGPAPRLQAHGAERLR